MNGKSSMKQYYQLQQHKNKTTTEKSSSNLNMEEIMDADYRYAKRLCKGFEKIF